MNPINKISGNLCSVCRTIISSESGNNLMCPKCQEKSLEILKESIRFLNGVPNGKYGDNYVLCSKIDEFLERLKDE